ncbi:MAG: GTPase HflX [Candidatus Thermoplasmatota archaeon]
MKAVLVYLGKELEKLDETVALAQILDYQIIEKFVQRKEYPRAKYLIGEGKLEELKNFIVQNKIELVIFENLLSSAQVLALEEYLKVPVIDRFDLILNVFEVRAKSKEAKLQIEIARLKRKLPYIKAFLGRKVKEDHPGFGGSGEFIIRNTITGLRRRIRKIEKELASFEVRVLEQVKQRMNIGKVISIAGYTNVGKTTLLNALTDSKMPVKDELFTTLATKISHLRRQEGEKIFVSDTIGFLNDLPHDLIYAFRATLSSIKNSDLILLVLDSSENLEMFRKKMSVCEQVLREVGASHIPIIYILNKIDKISGYELKLKSDNIAHPNKIGISALYNNGIEELKTKIFYTLKSIV